MSRMVAALCNNRVRLVVIGPDRAKGSTSFVSPSMMRARAMAIHFGARDR